MNESKNNLFAVNVTPDSLHHMLPFTIRCTGKLGLVLTLRNVMLGFSRPDAPADTALMLRVQQYTDAADMMPTDIFGNAGRLLVMYNGIDMEIRKVENH